MSINIQKITTESASRLKSKMMGGVSRESAVEAIGDAANKVMGAMQEEAKVAQRNFQTSIEQLRNTHAQEIASKDSFIRGQVDKLSQTEAALTTSQQENATLSQQVARFGDRIKRVLTFKKIKTNPDGSEVFAKANLNGTKAEKTVNSQGKVVQVNVEQLDGSVRRTTYNPETGKPVRTYTNTGKEPVEILYDQYGRTSAIRTVNVKKTVAPKPTPVGSPLILRDDESVRQIQTTMSDGSIKKVMVLKSNGEVIEAQHQSGPDYWSATGSYYTKENSGVRRFITRAKNTEGKIEDTWKTIFPSGITTIQPYSKVTDDFGITRCTARMTFPKSSQVKRIDRITVEGANSPAKEIIKMKDGTIYELTDFKKVYVEVPGKRHKKEVDLPQKGIMITKAGARQEMVVNEIEGLLNSIHPEFNPNLYFNL